MEILPALASSLLTPMVLAFALGVLASLVRSDLRIPPDIYSGLSIYLLLAIGLKGGMKLDGVAFGEVWKPLAAAVGLSLATPVWCFWMLRQGCRLSAANAGAIAAHYGSVSAVTFAAALAYLEKNAVPVEGYLSALLALMEVPAIVVAILLARRALGAEGAANEGVGKVLHELMTGKGILLLLGGMAIGWLSGKPGYAQVAPLFDAPFKGVLTLFLLEIGLVTGRHLADLKAVGLRLALFALVMPPLHGLIGLLLANMAGMSVGGGTVLATLAASASYIAAPAAVRLALPQASPALYFTTALALTFPFNVVFGIPLYHRMAQAVLGG